MYRCCSFTRYTAVHTNETYFCHAFHKQKAIPHFLQHCPDKMHKYRVSEVSRLQKHYIHIFSYSKYTDWEAIHYIYTM
jgi:hypothetical protein